MLLAGKRSCDAPGGRAAHSGALPLPKSQFVHPLFLKSFAFWKFRAINADEIKLWLLTSGS